MSAPFYVVLPDCARQRIALVPNVPNGNSFSLPKFSREEGTRFHTVATVNESVSSKWHASVTVSRCLNPGENGQSTVFSLHNHDQNWRLPAEASWVDVDELKNVHFDHPDQRQSVLDWLSSENDDSWKSVPWSSSGWFARATTWINESVESTGATVIGAPIQIRTWALSCVLRVSTTAGTLYFKAVPDFFGHEAILARYLLEHFPNYMIDLAAIEPEQHWMLTREFAGDEPVSRDDWHKVLGTLMEIQNHCRDNFDELLKSGCNDRRLALLPTLLQPILDELKQPQMRQLYGVNEEEASELSRRIQTLPELCQRLADCGISETLVHGDLWGPNVIMRDSFSGKSPMIFDWTDAAISHPFFDIYIVLTSEKDDAKRRDQRQAHIDVWSAVVPQEKVLQALALSEQVAPYYYLLAYRRVELNAPPQARWELMFLLTRFVRYILNSKFSP